ncbi:ribonuclease R [Peptostreptococcus russellii]|uniref:ribonuclease R n=1 Tax=Peptostreptococcus russellii TaxID=215200 RepID=UPI003F58EE3E
MLPNDIRENILGLINEEAYKPSKKDELANIFVEEENDREEFFSILDELAENGDIFINKRGKVGTLEDYEMKRGKFRSTKRAFGFVESEGEEKDVFIPEEDRNGAFEGDIVIAKLTKEATETKRPEGVIVKILKRENKTVVGLFQKSKAFGFVLPDNKKFDQDIFIPKSAINGAKNNDKVVCEIEVWPKDGKKPEGKIIEVIGQSGERYVEIDSIVRAHGLKEEFPKKVFNQTSKIPDHILEEEKKGRLDLTEEITYTIDGDDSKDFDDAIGVELLDNGNYRLGVHIADVTHYVTEHSPLDREALDRATSVYLVDKVIPMLPRELSNGICSLNPNVERLTLSCIMDVNPKNGSVESHVIKKSVIKSKARMTYTEISNLLENDDPEMIEKYSDFIDNLKNAEKLAEILRERREKRGAIDFDFSESKIVLDSKGYPCKIEEYERRTSNKMIEEFMLLANETIAEHFYNLKLPFVYRVHEDPSEEKLMRLKNFISEYGYKMPNSKGSVKPKDLQTVLESIEDREAKQAIGMIMLRTLKQARYSPECLGHFGLAARYYSHFTSPIRRYPDLQIHRIIKESIDGKLSSKRIKHFSEILEGVCNQSSTQEREAELAERDVDDYYKAVFMSDYIDEEFEGHISGVTSFGVFIELPNGVEGLIRLQDLPDYFTYHENSMILVGEHTKAVLKLGQKLKIRVSNVDIPTREIDFELVTDIFNKN